MLTKVILVGYDDNYQFKSDLASNKGAYIARKMGETEEFYISYEDTWVEAELTEMCDANSIKLDKTSIEMKVGETVEVKYSILPDNAISRSATVEHTSNIEINTDTFGVVKIKALEKGDAHIVVKLKPNNEINAKCEIKIVDETIEPTAEYITSKDYNINNEYISRIKPKTTISEFKEKITTNMEYKIYDKTGNIATGEALVSTGMKLKTEKQEYTLIVKGDINGDGKLSITDVARTNFFSVNLKTPNQIEKIAADVNENGKVNITDVVIIKLASVGLRKL